eukprot:Em0022g217a
MDPSSYPAYFPLPPIRQFPYPPSTSPSADTRAMIFYPQPLSSSDHSDKPYSPEDDSVSSPQSKRPADKKLRRQIANSNERRRMQSINAGFHTLKLLMPHVQGEKLSKASILQHAAEFIYRLNQDRERLVQQNTSLRMALSKYWPSADHSLVGEPVGGNRVSKATSPMVFDDEKSDSKELEQIFHTQKELERIKTELERERAIRHSLETSGKDQTPLKEYPDNEDEEEDEEENDTNDNSCTRKKPRTTSPEPRNNLDIIVRAIRQIEGDAFSRSATPTCATQERNIGNNGTFVPISSGKDSTRVSPPVCAL